MADGIQMVNKTFSLPMGTRFVAGESTEGNTLYYSLKEKAYVVPTILESVHTMFLQGTRVITAPIALEGKDNGVLFKNNNPEEPKFLCVGNNPDRKNIYGAALGLYNSRIVKLINKKGQLKSSVIIDELLTIYFNNVLPFSVSIYFCFGCFGLSGYSCST